MNGLADRDRAVTGMHERLCGTPGTTARRVRPFTIKISSAASRWNSVNVASTSSGLSTGGAGRSGCAEGAGPERRAEYLADEGSVGGMESADGGTRQGGLDGFATAPGSARLGRDPQVAGVAALEFRDDPRTGAEPPGQDLHGRGTERAR